MTETVAKLLHEIHLRLQRIEYALIPPTKVPPEEAKRFNKLFREALSGKTKDWRDVDRGLEG